jgi:hypothetical protein
MMAARLHERPFQLGSGSPPPQSVAVQGERSRSGPLRKTCSRSKVIVARDSVGDFQKSCDRFCGLPSLPGGTCAANVI